MRLKCIKLAGFKSFVDPTTVTFTNNLCAVVGPNGCGKSNIIDAVRWVMGESSAKNLRGESMTDVIFNGSHHRKPLGQASIELVFDNSDHTLKGEYAAYAEIAIRRKVTRDGQNQYYLNGAKCRRRDITDIFLGTGLGPRSYAIIEQGMISRLIEAKPEELRIFIEEAAGISKYKERRRDTESRMQRTRENLERLSDIRDELSRQLARLERQAEAAKQYTELKAQERQAKSDVQTLKWRALQRQLEQQQAAVTQAELSVEAALTTQVAQDADLEQQRQDWIEVGEAFQQAQERYYRLTAEISRLEQTLAHAEARHRDSQAELTQLEQDLAQLAAHQTLDQTQAQTLADTLASLAPQEPVLSSRAEQSAERLILAQEALQTWQEGWDRFNRDAEQPRQAAEVQQAQIRRLELDLQRNQAKCEALERTLQQLADQLQAGTLDRLQDALALARESRLEAEATSEAADAQYLAAASQEQTLRQTLAAAQSQHQSAEATYRSLSTLQASVLTPADPLPEWMQSPLAPQPMVQYLTVTPGYERALEVVLGDLLHAWVLESPVQQWPLTTGPWPSYALVSASQAPVMQDTRHPLASDSLLHQVSSSLDLSPWLASVRWVPDMEQAQQILPRLAAGESVITADGIWLGPGWLCAGGDSPQSGLVARQQWLAQLAETLPAFEQTLVQAEEDYRLAQEALAAAQLQRRHSQQQLMDAERQLSAADLALTAEADRQSELTERQTRLRYERDESREQITQDQEQLAEARLQWEVAQEAIERDVVRREELLAERERLQQALLQGRAQAEQDRDALYQLTLRVQSLNTQYAAITQGQSRLQDQVARLQERQITVHQAIADLLAPLDDYRDELEGLLIRRLSLESGLQQAKQARDEAEVRLKATEKARHSTELGLQRERLVLEQARLDLQAIRFQVDALEQQRLESGGDLASLTTDTVSLTEPDLTAQLAKLAHQLSRLGSINLAAMEEYQVEQERKTYLDTQDADLRDALATLEEAIRKIDRETRARFKDTFDQVNSGLQALFPTVFGGGQAYLELTGDDLLDTGVAIMAQPPGKRNSTIHLLSGGEKALTAIALVFSIFKLNPAPFCMLDEVDAPLDDANVGRYARLVSHMSTQVQFIYITHNKIAMEMATQLMGVTMHEPGCSRMVSVNLEEAATLAAQEESLDA